MKHKHADVIKAWADGVPCQFRASGISSWMDMIPASDAGYEYRIKPSAVVTYPSDEQTDDHTGICMEVEA